MLRLSRPNLREDALEGVQDVLRSGWLLQGHQNAAFEAELAAFLDVPHVATVSSGTAALHLALLAAGIGPGDAVVVPDFTFVATANAVALTGARPVLVDVEERSYTLRADLVADVIEGWRGPERLRALMPVHEFGAAADLDALGSLAATADLLLIEDAACALGARWSGARLGSIGLAGCFSFHPRKTLTTGEGGAVATRSDELADRLRRLRNHGIERTADGIVFQEAGFNYRLTDFQAAMGRAQLATLDDWIAQRRSLAATYAARLAPLVERFALALPAAGEHHSWQTYMIVLAAGVDRRAVVEDLKACGVEAGPGAQCVSAQPSFAGHPVATHGRHVARMLHDRGLALPFCEQYGTAEVEQVVAALGESLARRQR